MLVLAAARNAAHVIGRRLRETRRRERRAVCLSAALKNRIRKRPKVRETQYSLSLAFFWSDLDF